MIITDYMQAFQQNGFTDATQKQRILSSFSDALMDYAQSPTAGSDAALNKLDSFYFALPMPDEATDMSTEDMLTITNINEEVVAAEVSDMLQKNGISEAEPVRFSIDKFGHMVADRHTQSNKIMELLKENPAIANRIRSTLSDASTAAHEVHQDYLDAQAANYGGSTKAALLKEKNRSIPPAAEFTIHKGKITTTYYGNSLDGWMNIYKKLIGDMIIAEEAKKLKFLLERTT
jgi:effector-binding domain-containing protein